VVGPRPGKATIDEAVMVRAMVREENIRSVILVTSPTHCRRAWLTFRNVLGEDNVRIMMRPSRYSDFEPEGWWKERKSTREVIIEYQKLIYYALKYFL
jgi:uncharacterized SAM-binding protein YcdF (DUF218 family)